MFKQAEECGDNDGEEKDEEKVTDAVDDMLNEKDPNLSKTYKLFNYVMRENQD